MSEMMCCPLSEPDECAQVYRRTNRTARKRHVCCECRAPIEPGALHDYTSMLFDGQWDSWRTCLLCTEIGDHLSCGSRVVGALWEDLEENFFPAMTAGGPCMEGLSPAAKAMLFERRMAWLLTSGTKQNGASPPWHGGAP